MPKPCALLLWVIASAAFAQPSGTPDAPACRRALDALQAQEEALVSAPTTPATRERLLVARHQAALACLGGPDTPASAPPRAARPAPAATPRVVVPAWAPPAAMTSPAPVAKPPVPVTINACDAQGCWASDGTRLQRVGSNLLGPRGLCSVQGAVLTCP